MDLSTHTHTHTETQETPLSKINFDVDVFVLPQVRICLIISAYISTSSAAF